MGELWQGDGVHGNGRPAWVQGGGRQLAQESSLTGESLLCMATTLVAAVTGDRLSRCCDRRPGLPDSIGPIPGFSGPLMGQGFSVKWAWVGLKGFGLILV